MSLCLDIERCLISNLVLTRSDGEVKSSSYRKVQGFLEATYSKHENFMSEDFLVRPGNCVAVPCFADAINLVECELFAVGFARIRNHSLTFARICWD